MGVLIECVMVSDQSAKNIGTLCGEYWPNRSSATKAKNS